MPTASCKLRGYSLKLRRGKRNKRSIRLLIFPGLTWILIDGYARPCAQPGIRHVGCWAHVRRPFKEADEALGKVSRRAVSALQALGFIAKLYRAESQLSQSEGGQMAVCGR